MNHTRVQIPTQAGIRHTQASVKKKGLYAAQPTGAPRPFTCDIPKLDAPGQFSSCCSVLWSPQNKREANWKVQKSCPNPSRNEANSPFVPRQPVFHTASTLGSPRLSPNGRFLFLHTKAPIDSTPLAHHSHPWKKKTPQSRKWICDQRFKRDGEVELRFRLGDETQSLLINSRLQTTKAPLSELAVRLKEGESRDDILALSIHDTEEADLRKKNIQRRKREWICLSKLRVSVSLRLALELTTLSKKPDEFIGYTIFALRRVGGQRQTLVTAYFLFFPFFFNGQSIELVLRFLYVEVLLFAPKKNLMWRMISDLKDF